MADDRGGITVTVLQRDGHGGAFRNFQNASPGLGIIGEFHRIRQTLRRGLVQHTALQRDRTWQRQAISPALRLPGWVLGGVVTATVAVKQTEDDRAVVAALLRNRSGRGVGVARPGEVVAKVHALETLRHGEHRAIKAAHDIAGNIAALAL